MSMHEVKIMYEYKCVPAPMRLIVKNEKDMDNAVRNFSELINQNTAGGWEFYSMEEIICEVTGGCLASFFMLRHETVRHNMLVFRREC